MPLEGGGDPVPVTKVALQKPIGVDRCAYRAVGWFRYPPFSGKTENRV